MMDIIRAWKDEEYRLSLSQEQRALLPENPAGLMELSDADLKSVVGGLASFQLSVGLCVCADVNTTINFGFNFCLKGVHL